MGTPPVDGRTERWREHRIARRREFVDAALRALEHHGPEVSVAQIAEEAGVAKPRLYRHFTDKADLLAGVQRHLSELLWQRMSAVLDPTDEPEHLVRAGLQAFLGLVDEHPNAFRLMLLPSAVSPSTAERVMADGRKLGQVLSSLIAGQLRVLGVDVETADPYGHALAGAVGAATLWWLDTRAVTKDQLVDQMVPPILGALAGISGTVSHRPA